MKDLNRWTKEQQEIDDYILKLEEKVQHQKIKIDDLLDLISDCRESLIKHVVCLDVLPEAYKKELTERAVKFDLEISSILERPF